MIDSSYVYVYLYNRILGVRPTTSPLHYDDYENFLCQIKGQKEVIHLSVCEWIQFLSLYLTEKILIVVIVQR